MKVILVSFWTLRFPSPLLVPLLALASGGETLFAQSNTGRTPVADGDNEPASVSPGFLEEVTSDQPTERLTENLELAGKSLATGYTDHLRKRGQLPAFKEQAQVLDLLKRLQQSTLKLKLQVSKSRKPEAVLPLLAKVRDDMENALEQLAPRAQDFALLEANLWRIDDTLFAIEHQFGIVHQVEPVTETASGEVLEKQTAPEGKSNADGIPVEEPTKARRSLFGDKKGAFRK